MTSGPTTFKFRLQRLLELREQQELVCRQNLAEAERRHLEAVEARRMLHSRIVQTELELRARQQGSLAIHDLMACARFLDALNGELTLQERRIEEAAQQVQEARHCLHVAGVARKVVDKLRTRAHDAWRDATLKAEISFLDEMSCLRFNRRSTAR